MSEQKECEYVSKNEINKSLLHLNWANRRMLIAIVTVCITAIIISIGSILIFVNSYTAREKNWQETYRDLINKTLVTEVNNGQKTD